MMVMKFLSIISVICICTHIAEWRKKKIVSNTLTHLYKWLINLIRNVVLKEFQQHKPKEEMNEKHLGGHFVRISFITSVYEICTMYIHIVYRHNNETWRDFFDFWGFWRKVCLTFCGSCSWIFDHVRVW